MPLRSSEARAAALVESELDALLAPVLSPRRTAAGPARGIAALARGQQDFVLHWTGVIARTSAELAFQFAVAAPAALTSMDPDTAEAWVVHALDACDREGLHSGTQALTTFEDFARNFGTPAAVKLDDVAAVLRLFVQGLSGTRPRMDSAPRAYTDGETMYLPPAISRGATSRENFLHYKVAAALLWAQTAYGTFDADLGDACDEFSDPQRALQLLSALETIRLEARIGEAFPGLAREMSSLRGESPLDPRCARLLDPAATIQNSIALLAELYDDPPVLPDLWGTVLDPSGLPRAGETKARRKDSTAAAAASARPASGKSPADASSRDEEPDAPAPPSSPAFLYDEWDHRRRRYRKNWCALRESDVAPGDPGFVEATLATHAHHVKRLKRVFELMRGEDRLLRRQPDGDGIDLDALIEAYADLRSGAELSALLFTRRQRNERDIAVMFMVDMSGSTKGWVNQAEREALVMLCEALEVLGDRYAIYGFSGLTRRHCDIFAVKRFDERYDETVRSRISGITPHDYTRMGAAIRHLSMLLNRVEARTRLLVTLSDGKPDDYSDEYRGEYGIEDTRRALLEAHESGIRPFCITIDREARGYLPHMYGHVNWTLIDDIAHLPHRMGQIYGELTR